MTGMGRRGREGRRRGPGGKVRARKRENLPSPVYSTNPAALRTGSEKEQQPRAQFCCPTWAAGSQALKPSLLTGSWIRSGGSGT